MENDIIKKEKGGYFVLATIIVFVLEMFGTGWLVYCINLQNNLLAIPLALFCSIIISGPITGGHCNPAVTLSVFILRYQEIGENLYWLFVYWIAQLTGAVAGGWLAIKSVEPPTKDVHLKIWPLPYLAPQNGQTEGGTFLMEMLCTMVFISVINTAKEARLTSNLAGNTPVILLGIALALMAQVFIAGGWTGGSFNPAVTVALATECAQMCGKLYQYADCDPEVACRKYFWIYTFAPFAGGFLASVLALQLARMSGWLTGAGQDVVKSWFEEGRRESMAAVDRPEEDSIYD